jgi:hypothetical protein
MNKRMTNPSMREEQLKKLSSDEELQKRRMSTILMKRWGYLQRRRRSQMQIENRKI